jgi:nucleoid DNA-binding protein
MDVIQLTLDTITEELAAGRSSEFRNFGVFEVMRRKERVGATPNTQDRSENPGTRCRQIQTGQGMRKLVLKLDPQ